MKRWQRILDHLDASGQKGTGKFLWALRRRGHLQNSWMQHSVLQNLSQRGWKIAFGFWIFLIVWSKEPSIRKASLRRGSQRSEKNQEMIRRHPKLKKSILLLSTDQETNYLPLPICYGKTLKRSKLLFTTGNRVLRLVCAFCMIVNWGRVWCNLPRVNKSVQSQLPGLQAAGMNAFGKVNDEKIGL